MRNEIVYLVTGEEKAISANLRFVTWTEGEPAVGKKNLNIYPLE